jgi:hypothetical protein
MEILDIQNFVVNEIKKLPENKLYEVYNFIRHFRMETDNKSGVIYKNNIEYTMNFAGIWKELPANFTDNFIEEVKQRRKKSFLGRRNNETGVDRY